MAILTFHVDLNDNARVSKVKMAMIFACKISCPMSVPRHAIIPHGQ